MIVAYPVLWIDYRMTPWSPFLTPSSPITWIRCENTPKTRLSFSIPNLFPPSAQMQPSQCASRLPNYTLLLPTVPFSNPPHHTLFHSPLPNSCSSIVCGISGIFFLPWSISVVVYLIPSRATHYVHYPTPNSPIQATSIGFTLLQRGFSFGISSPTSRGSFLASIFPPYIMCRLTLCDLLDHLLS